jgi:hypothetical protein
MAWEIRSVLEGLDRAVPGRCCWSLRLHWRNPHLYCGTCRSAVGNSAEVETGTDVEANPVTVVVHRAVGFGCIDSCHLTSGSCHEMPPDNA